MSKSRTQSFLESPGQLLVLTLSVIDLCWLQPIQCWNVFGYVLLVAGLLEHGLLSTDSRTIFEGFMTHFYLCCPHYIIPESLLNHPNSFLRGMFKLNTKSDADYLYYSLSRFECHSHTVHILTQCCPPHPLTSTVKLPLFTHVHFSPLSLAARLHQWCVNCSCDNDSGWILSGQTSYVKKNMKNLAALKHRKYERLTKEDISATRR